MMKLISELSLPPKKKQALVKAMFRTLARKYLFTSGMLASKPRHHGVPPGCRMFLDKQDIRRLRQHGVRIYSLLKDVSKLRARVLYWVSIILP